MPARSRLPDSVPPNPADLIESMRDFGYTLPSALADLINNSLAARAKTVSVVVEPSTPSSHIAVMDDGEGMSEERVVEAMRMGTMGPHSNRATSDLGRFGLGMKTASLSQGRCVTVISKKGRDIAVRCWNLEHVRRTKDWQLLSEPTPTSSTYYEQLSKQRHGTAIVIEQLDRASFVGVPEPSRTAHLASALEVVRSHLLSLT